MKLETAIKYEMNKLLKKSRKNGLYENFGDKEIRTLKDKFDYLSLVYGNDMERKQAKMIDAFENWCMEYTGN